MAEALARLAGAVGRRSRRTLGLRRISRDGTLHVATRDAIWAFELGHRSGEIAAALGVPAVRFATGKIPIRARAGNRSGHEAAVRADRGAAVCGGLDLRLRSRTRTARRGRPRRRGGLARHPSGALSDTLFNACK